ncbi:GNAT family N-acetyltransferase [[Flexibacter] sp. ATCC 35103]|uniref:GNAT family N-acetyltransferase n=1 Tax=[Flexibacter] sp. ATCC 35103 TaxID=1937528 RepID=UPI0009D4AEED|nr:GNAT family N-acetyltransferase [[Flexibacter] sp. ATCC 35103]OMQ10333.1 GNAT family N-acetyltransferase [[Flexibacter] sp. ATCC 35103]
MKPQIIPIENKYSDVIVDLILNIQQKEFNVAITIEDQPDLLNIQNFYYGGGGHFWGAFVDDELVGTIALVKFNNTQAAIRKMFVKKEYRGKEFSIAQKLLDTLVDYCTKNQIEDLYLGTITVLEAALRFYERNNFIRIEKVSLPNTFPVMSADNVFCHLKLKK